MADGEGSRNNPGRKKTQHCINRVMKTPGIEQEGEREPHSLLVYLLCSERFEATDV